jgi:hypothetical protein
MRVGDNFFSDAISSRRIGVYYSITEIVMFQSFYFSHEVPFFFVKETRAVSDKIFHVPELGPIYCGIVEFCQSAPPYGVPDLTICRVGSAHAVFVPPGPLWGDPWCAEGIVNASETGQS